jgi:glycine/D-amino acid oxidase-like deaminating enzyme
VTGSTAGGRGCPAGTRAVSFWWQQLAPAARRPPLAGSVSADVCIVGAGYTGLWTAYYLACAEPALRIVVCEARHAGFGASGRNGGWVTSALPGSRARYRAGPGGRAGVLALQQALNDSVTEVGRVCAAEGIDADYHRGGSLTVARTSAQVERLRAEVGTDRQWGLADTRWLGAGEARERLRVAGARGAAFTPHCARIQPARLVAGLAAAAERRGVTLCEDTPVTSLRPGRAVTARGSVRAAVVLRATEGFTAALPGRHRTWLPMNSSMVVTEPLSAPVWERIGWAGRETLGDAAHAYVYAQRTADDRIAFGGRGVPYRFGSRTDTDGATPAATVAALRHQLGLFFPAAAGAAIAAAWSGVLGVPRDWCAGVGLDRVSGLGWAGGYTGHGVAAANLAGRTLRDLVLGARTELTALPWVGHRSRPWEPEPLRWLGVHALYAAYRGADALEARPGAGAHTPALARVADRVAGRPH